MESSNGKLNEAIDRLYSELDDYGYGTDERASMISEIEKLEHLRQNEVKIELERDSIFDEKVENIKKEKSERKKQILTYVFDGLKIIVPVLVWKTALNSQMFLETGERLTRYNATRNVLNVPKLNIK